MNYPVIRNIVENNFISNYAEIQNYFQQNNLVYNNECVVDGGFGLNFSGSDTKQLFEKNLKVQPKNWYYRNNKVNYTLNSLGYRTREFDQIDWKKSIVIFGCSVVYGDGVTDEHTISYFLEQLTGIPVINMGIGGSSIQTALHNSIILRDSGYEIPKAIIYHWTEFGRFHGYTSDYVFHMGSWSEKDLTPVGFNSKQNLTAFNLMNIKAIRNLWKNKTIYYEGTIFDSQAKLINKLSNEIDCKLFGALEVEGEFARDMAHLSHTSNENIAKKIYEDIKPQLNT